MTSKTTETPEQMLQRLAAYTTTLSNQIQANSAASSTVQADLEAVKNLVVAMPGQKKFMMRLSDAPTFKGKRALSQLAKNFFEIVDGTGRKEVAFALYNKFEGFAKEWFNTISGMDPSVRDLNQNQLIHEYLAGIRAEHREFIASREPQTFERARQLAANKDNQGAPLNGGRDVTPMDVDELQTEHGDVATEQPLLQTIAELVAAVKDLKADGWRGHSGGGMSTDKDNSL